MGSGAAACLPEAVAVALPAEGMPVARRDRGAAAHARAMERCGGDASPTLTHVRRRRSLDSTDRPPTPRDDASPRPPSGDVEAANPAFGFFGPAEADGGRARMRTSPSRGGGPSPGARPFSAPSQDGGAGPKPVGGGGGGGGSPPAKAAPAQASRRSWAGFAVALLLALALLVGVGVDRAVHTPRPSCAVEVGLRAWGKPDPVNHWLNVTVDLDVSATGNVPFYAPYDVTLAGGSYTRVVKTWNLNVTKPTAYGRVEGAVGNWWMHLQPGARPLGMGLTVEVWRGDGMPEAVTVNGVNCTLTRRPTARPAGGPGAPPPLTSALKAVHGRLVDADAEDGAGSPVFLAGVNVMGYEYGLTLFDGIGTGERKDSVSQDLATIAWRMRLLGANAVRLPFNFHSVMTRAADAAQAPCWQVPDADVVKATTDPSYKKASLPPVPALDSPPRRRRGWCNDFVPPGEALLDRFLWVVHFFASNGFYVVLDNQFNYDMSAMEDTGLWVAQWRKLGAELVARYPDAARRVLLDVLNEPDVWGLGWQKKNESMPSAGDLYLEAMDALHTVSPHWQFIVQGCGQQGLAKNWGDGLATDPAVIAAGASDPRPFFEALLKKPYLQSVLLGPHVYPPSVYDTERNAPEGNQGPELFARLSQSFGYLNKKGYCGKAGKCHVFPILLGETGSGFVDDRDWQAQVDLAEWATATGAGADGLHEPLAGVFWWAWGLGHGPDGPDHVIVNDMGIVGRDWTTVDWKKVRFLQRFGFQPWYTAKLPPEGDAKLPGGRRASPPAGTGGGSGGGGSDAGDDD